MDRGPGASARSATRRRSRSGWIRPYRRDGDTSGSVLRSRRHRLNRETEDERDPWFLLPTPPSRLRPRRPSRSPPPPPPPSAPILGLLLRATDCAKQPLDSLLHLFPNHVADHGDQALSSRHTSPPGSAYSSISEALSTVAQGGGTS